jgi:hypothetical protein
MKNKKKTDKGPGADEAPLRPTLTRTDLGPGNAADATPQSKYNSIFDMEGPPRFEANARY